MVQNDVHTNSVERCNVWSAAPENRKGMSYKLPRYKEYQSSKMLILVDNTSLGLTNVHEIITEVRNKVLSRTCIPATPYLSI